MLPSDLTLAMTLTLKFQGQIWDHLYLDQNGPIATRQKANLSIELYASNVTIGFEFGHDFNYEFSKSNLEFAKSQPKMVWLPQNENYAYRMKWRPQ